MAAALTSFSYYDQSAFFNSVFLRNHNPVLTQLNKNLSLKPTDLTNLTLSLTIGISAGAGTLIGNKLADRAAHSGISGYTKQPIIVLLASTPFLSVTPFAPNLPLALATLAVGVFLHAMAYGPTFASMQMLTNPHIRATTSTILFFLTSLIGLKLGPLAVKVANDLLRASLRPVQSLNLAYTGASITMVASVVCFNFATRQINDEAPARSASVNNSA